jgi:bifunctional DNA-binding transcriptional regulator/antitoxin component of YhaV-PrlF toxin-antitoxin module
MGVITIPKSLREKLGDEATDDLGECYKRVSLGRQRLVRIF